MTSGNDFIAISIHALREEGDETLLMSAYSSLFLSTPSARRATPCPLLSLTSICDFYPRPPRGGRLLGIPEFLHQRIISIHALREEGDIMAAIRDFSLVLFLSTPSARRATDAPLLLQYGVGISIHALREEGDVIFGGCLIDDLNFYPRPPRGGRPFNKRMRDEVGKFLSTPSARRATFPFRSAIR